MNIDSDWLQGAKSELAESSSRNAKCVLIVEEQLVASTI